MNTSLRPFYIAFALIVLTIVAGFFALPVQNATGAEPIASVVAPASDKGADAAFIRDMLGRPDRVVSVRGAEGAIAYHYSQVRCVVDVYSPIPVRPDPKAAAHDLVFVLADDRVQSWQIVN